MTYSGDTNTTVCNTLRSLAYGHVAVYASGFNVLGFPTWEQGKPSIAVIAKGDDTLYIGTRSSLEKVVEEGFPVVYYTPGKEDKCELFQICKGYTYEMEFLSTKAHMEENICEFVTRDLKRYLLMSNTVAHVFNPNLLRKYTMQDLVASRLYVDGLTMMAIAGDSPVYSMNAAQQVTKALMLSTSSHAQGLKKLYKQTITRDEMYQKILLNPKVRQEVWLDYSGLYNDEQKILNDMMFLRDCADSVLDQF